MPPTATAGTSKRQDMLKSAHRSVVLRAEDSIDLHARD
jgi:hypothetical protein